MVVRDGSDLEWLWLWCRPAAVAPIWPLAWEPPYALEAALEKAKKKKKKKKIQKIQVSGLEVELGKHVYHILEESQ